MPLFPIINQAVSNINREIKKHFGTQNPLNDSILQFIQKFDDNFQNNHKYSIDYVFPDGESLLIKAIKFAPEIIDDLFNAGVNPDERATDGTPAIILAAKLRINLKSFVDAHADVNATDHDGKTVLHHLIRERDLKTLLAANIKLNALDRHKRNALFYARTRKMVRALVAAKIELHRRDEDFKTALFFADTPDVVKELIIAGLRINALDKNGQNALFRLNPNYIEHINVGLELAENGINLDHVDTNGNKPEILSKLQPDSYLGLSFGDALCSYHYVMVREYLTLHTDPNQKIRDTYPLIHAVKVNSPMLIRILCKAGANPNLGTTLVHTPLYYAITLRRPECVRELLSAGAQWNQESILDAICHNTCSEVVHCFEEIIPPRTRASYQIEKKTPEADHDILAAAAGSSDELKNMIAAGAPLNVQNDIGNDLMTIAASANEFQNVNILIQTARSQFDNESKNKALSVAINQLHIETIRELIYSDMKISNENMRKALNTKHPHIITMIHHYIDSAEFH